MDKHQLNKTAGPLLWVLYIVLLVATIYWLIPRSYFDIADPFFVMSSIQSLATHGPAHMDFEALLRPGYILNVPFYWLGFNYPELRYLCVLALLLVSVFTYFGFDSLRDRRWMFPLFMLLGLCTLMLKFRFLLDYWSVPFLGLMIGLAAEQWSKRSKHYVVWLLISAAGFWVMAIGSVVSLIAACLAVLIVSLTAFQCRYLILAIPFYVVTAATCWLYFDHWQVWQMLMHYTQLYSPAHHQNMMVYQISSANFYFMCLICGVIIGIIVGVSEKLSQAIGGVAAILLAVSWLFLINPIFQHAIQCFLLGLLLMGMLLPIYRQEGWRQGIAHSGIVFVIALTWLLICAASMSAFLLSPYLAILMMWFFAKNERLNVRQHILFIFMLISFAVMLLSTIAVNLMPVDEWLVNMGHRGNPSYNVFMNTTDSRLGVKMTPWQSQSYDQLYAAYHQYHCEHKAFLALYDAPDMYYLFNRLPPYHQSFIAYTAFYPINKYTSGEHLLDYLKAAGSWCVMYREYPDQVLKDQALKRHMAIDYIKENHTHAVVTLMHKPFLPVILYVKQ